MSRDILHVNSTSGTFGDWFDKTNEIVDFLANDAVTANATANGATTTGNGFVLGIFGANTLVVYNSLRGGNVQTANVLTISSNVSIGNSTANAVLGFGTFGIGNSTVNVYANSTGFFINGNPIGTGGSNTQIQFNDSGAANGSASWVFDKSAIKVTLGNSTVNVAMNSSTIVVSSNASVTLPVGNTGQRPTGAAGMMRFNSETNSFEGYGSTWGTIGGGAGYFVGTNGPQGLAAGAGDIFRLTSNSLGNNAVITAGNNAVIAGPLAVATGFTLTIGSGSRVVIV